MEDLDIGPCPFKVGDNVKVVGWAATFRGLVFEVGGAKIYDAPHGDGLKKLWVVHPTAAGVEKMKELWDADLWGDLFDEGEKETWWWVGYLEFHSTNNLENE